MLSATIMVFLCSICEFHSASRLRTHANYLMKNNIFLINFFFLLGQINEEVDVAPASNGQTKKLSISGCPDVGSCNTIDDSNKIQDLAPSRANEDSADYAMKVTVTATTSGENEPKVVVEDRKKSTETEKSNKAGCNIDTNNTCCNANRQFDCKNIIKKQETWSDPNDASDNLDVAMQKLESMRMSDTKSKRKQSGGNGKRQNFNLIQSSPSTNDPTSIAASRAKSPPTSAMSQLGSSPPSKTRKRKLRRRLKVNQSGGSHSDDADAGASNDACKSVDGETTTEARTMTTSKMATCDSNKNIDACGSRTNVNDTKEHTNRKWASDCEKTYLSSLENDRLR